MAQEELQETQRLLDAAKARLADVEEGIASLQAKYEECIAKKQDLEFKTEQCTARLGRAEKVRGFASRVVSHLAAAYTVSGQMTHYAHSQVTCSDRNFRKDICQALLVSRWMFSISNDQTNVLKFYQNAISVEDSKYTFSSWKFKVQFSIIIARLVYLQL